MHWFAEIGAILAMGSWGERVVNSDLELAGMDNGARAVINLQQSATYGSKH